MLPSRMIPEDWKLSSELSKRLGTKIGRQRMIHDEGQMLLILHYLPELDSSDRTSLFLWKEDAKAKWRAHASKDSLSPSLEELLEAYDDHVEALDDRFDEGVGLKEHFAVLESLNPILRSSRNISDVIDSALQFYPKDSLLVESSERAHSVRRVAELLSMSVKNNLEFLQASQLEVDNQLNHRLATAAHKLNLIVAMFLPLTAITSLFGMNLVNGLEEGNKNYFLYVLAGGLCLGLVLMIFIGRFPALPVLKSIPRKIYLTTLKEIPFINSKKGTKTNS